MSQYASAAETNPLILTTNSKTLRGSDFVKYWGVVLTITGTTVTLPTPIRSTRNLRLLFVNAYNGAQTLSGTFVGGSSVTLPAYGVLEVIGVQTAAATYKWAANDASASLTAAQLATLVHAASAKTTLVAADELLLIDSEASNVLKKVTQANLLAGAGVPVKASGAEINTGTDDAKFVTAKAIADSALSKGKAAGTDINTGTDDAKFVTAKAIADSTYGVLAGSTAPTSWTWVSPGWGAGTPAGMTITAKRIFHGKFCEWWIHIVTTNPGAGAGALTGFAFQNDMYPALVASGVHFPASGIHRKDTGSADTWTTLQGMIDVQNATPASRTVTIKNDVVWANNEATELFIKGSHYIA